MWYLINLKTICVVFSLLLQFSENLFTVRTGCNRPSPVANGFYTSRGVVNQVYPTGTTVKYHCDANHQMTGASVFTCDGQDWSPKELPTCKPVVNAEQQIGESNPT